MRNEVYARNRVMDILGVYDYNEALVQDKPIEESTTKKRIVFEVDETGFSRKYIFKGKFVYDEERSDPFTSQYLNKISDSF